MMMRSIVSKINIFEEGDEPFFGTSVTEVSLDDEAAGVFIKLVQFSETRKNELRFELTEIDTICEALQSMKTVGEEISNA